MSENKQQTTAPKNAVVEYKSGLVKIQQLYVDMIAKNAQEMALSYDEYQVSCVRSAISKMVELLRKDGLTINDIDQNNLTETLETIALLRINMNAVPNEGYFMIRNTKVSYWVDGEKKEKWIKEFEFGLEGDGNDKLLRKYGVDIKKVHNYWLVREGDDFVYPSFEGLSVVPPKWSPKGYVNDVVRVVYPIELMDGSVQFLISEREGATVNLQAHIINNIKMLKEDKMSYTKKQEISKRIALMSLEEMLNDDELRGIMSPAWRDPHSQEAMIVRKMRNNATKKYPKEYENVYVKQAYEKTFDDYEQYQEKPAIDQSKVVDAEVDELAGKETINVQNINESVNEQVEPEVVETPQNTQQEGKAKPKAPSFE